MTVSENAIEVRGVTKLFGSGDDAVRALDDVSVEIRENEFFTLLGPSGCGKTTLLRLIAGFEQTTTGTILLGGEDIAPLPPYQRPVNTVFQSYALFPHMTVSQNVGFGLRMQGRSAQEISDRVSQMLRLVEMERLGERKVAQLSGGQQQRVALARALANKPRVLLLDEPLSALDFKLRKQMQIELKKLQLETGITFIFVTHDQEEALTMSDRVAVMDKGSILQVGTPDEIYERPSCRFVADFIGETNLLKGEVLALEGTGARVRLAGSPTEISARLADGAPHSGLATIAIRPEHARLVAAGEESQLSGEVENIVYRGSDTAFHLKIKGHENGFVVRATNQAGGERQFRVGQAVAIQLQPSALQVLAD
jgi:spermidine/putrescine transport system ATP-binding protein